MLNRCIGCYYHDIKENVCTHGSPIFIDDVCTDYQDSDFVKQIRAEVIALLEECAEEIENLYGRETELSIKVRECLKEQK